MFSKVFNIPNFKASGLCYSQNRIEWRQFCPTKSVLLQFRYWRVVARNMSGKRTGQKHPAGH